MKRSVKNTHRTPFFLFVVLFLVGGYFLFSLSEQTTGNLVLKPVICGNRIFSVPEECEDCNIRSNDGCSSRCKEEYCGDGVIQSSPSEVCDTNVGCSFNYACDPESCTYCIPLQGKPPLVSVTASPQRITGTGTVLFSVQASDSDDFLIGYKRCIHSTSLYCTGGGGGRGCTNFIAIQPTKTFSTTYTRSLQANLQSTSDTQVDILIFFDQKGNKGAASVVVPIYK